MHADTEVDETVLGTVLAGMSGVFALAFLALVPADAALGERERRRIKLRVRAPDDKAFTPQIADQGRRRVDGHLFAEQASLPAFDTEGFAGDFTATRDNLLDENNPVLLTMDGGNPCQIRSLLLALPASL